MQLWSSWGGRSWEGDQAMHLYCCCTCRWRALGPPLRCASGGQRQCAVPKSERPCSTAHLPRVPVPPASVTLGRRATLAHKPQCL